MTALAHATGATAQAGALAERIRDARERRTPLRIRGAGTWMDAGAPVRAGAELPAVAGGIVEYVPGDLTLTALAGTPLSEIARATAAHGQWLALDPPGDPGGTLGATVATASAGPLAAGFGAVRDAVLGMEVVTGTGDVVRGGGRVVKNVAGFDLCRLFTGSWGTLGVITEVTVRLRALPEQQVSCALSLAGGDAPDAQLLALRTLPFAPMAAQLLNANLAARLGLPPRDVLLLRLGGNDAALHAQHESISHLGELTDVAPDAWNALSRAEPPGAMVVRMSNAPSALPELWRRLRGTLESRADVAAHACVARGTVRMIVPATDAGTARDDVLRIAIADACARGNAVILERAPSAFHTRAPSTLEVRVRDAFDPARILNPGILGAG